MALKIKLMAPKLVLLTSLLASASFLVCADEINASVMYDNYSKANGIATDKFKIPDVGTFLDPAFAYAYLTAVVPDRGPESLALRIEFQGHGWAFLETAQDIEGNTLPATVIDRKVLYGDRISEDVAANLTKDYLERRVDSGLNIRFSGKYRSVVVQLPSDYVKTLLSRLAEVESTAKAKPAAPLAQISANRVKLGVQYRPVTEQIALLSNSPSGVMVFAVEPGSVAEQAGFKKGDIVVRVDDKPVAPIFTGLTDALSKSSPGDKVRALIWRAGQQQTLEIQF